MQSPTPLDEEYTFEKGLIISSTDLKGIITYANRKFCEIAGYHKDELIGKNHNIIRHPDMPKAAFQGLWETLSKGEEWAGPVKNLRKDGKYYWVHTHITPVLSQEGVVMSYTAARRPVSTSEIDAITSVYHEMLTKEKNNAH